MSWASSSAQLPGRSAAVHERPALLALIVNQLVTQLRYQTLKRNLEPRSPHQREGVPRLLTRRSRFTWLITGRQRLTVPCAPCVPQRGSRPQRLGRQPIRGSVVTLSHRQASGHLLPGAPMGVPHDGPFAAAAARRWT